MGLLIAFACCASQPVSFEFQPGWRHSPGPRLAPSRTGPGTEGTGPAASAVVVFAATFAALIYAAIVGVFNMPIVLNVQLAQQGLEHGPLRSNRLPAEVGNLIIAFAPSPQKT
jgi:hypothetical protein